MPSLAPQCGNAGVENTRSVSTDTGSRASMGHEGHREVRLHADGHGSRRGDVSCRGSKRSSSRGVERTAHAAAVLVMHTWKCGVFAPHTRARSVHVQAPDTKAPGSNITPFIRKITALRMFAPVSCWPESAPAPVRKTYACVHTCA